MLMTLHWTGVGARLTLRVPVLHTNAVMYTE